MKMLKRERFYDGKGNELHIDESKSGIIKVSVNGNEIEVPLMKLFDMLKSSDQPKGRHAAKVYEIR